MRCENDCAETLAFLHGVGDRVDPLDRRNQLEAREQPVPDHGRVRVNVQVGAEVTAERSVSSISWIRLPDEPGDADDAERGVGGERVPPAVTEDVDEARTADVRRVVQHLQREAGQHEHDACSASHHKVSIQRRAAMQSSETTSEDRY